MPTPKARDQTALDAERFATAVASWRERSSLTLQQVADELGTSVQNVSNWARGKRPRSRKIAERLDEVLAAGGEIVRAYDLEPADMAARIAELEARLAKLEEARDVAIPQVAKNSAELARGWDALTALIEQVQHLDLVVQRIVDPSPPEPEAEPDPER
jgi:transcriptional regulator with XRE-family HTH domain